jgi:hypothetical protein
MSKGTRNLYIAVSVTKAKKVEELQVRTARVVAKMIGGNFPKITVIYPYLQTNSSKLESRSEDRRTKYCDRSIDGTTRQLRVGH